MICKKCIDLHIKIKSESDQSAQLLNMLGKKYCNVTQQEPSNLSTKWSFTHVSLEQKAAKCMLPGCDKMALLTNLLFVRYTCFVIGERHEHSTFVVQLEAVKYEEATKNRRKTTNRTHENLNSKFVLGYAWLAFTYAKPFSDFIQIS